MSRKSFVCLVLMALISFRSSAYVMVTLGASGGMGTSTLSAEAYATGVSTNTGIFTVSRGGTLTNVTINLSVSGTAVPGVDYVPFPTNITLAANAVSSNLTVSLESGAVITNAKTVVLGILTNSAYLMGLETNAIITLLPISDTTNSATSPVGRYWRGTGNDPSYWSQVIPLDYEQGTVYSNLNGNAATLYGIQSWFSTNYLFNATSHLSQAILTNRIPFNNPIVAFGERVGGTPLYLNQPYSFGVYNGEPLQPVSSTGSDMVIFVVNRSNYQIAGYITLYPPEPGTATWTNWENNGFVQLQVTNLNANEVPTNYNFGLTTAITTAPDMTWGASTSSGGTGFILTHTASSQATNYYYLVLASGFAPGGAPMAITSSGATNYSDLYSLEFEPVPAWRSTFLTQPQFDGSPLPPFYAGETVAEIMTNTPPVTNPVTILPSAATNLDDSPELRRDPILDNFVASMGNDPIALANYVLNQIDLTDPMDYSGNGNLSTTAINPTGVKRDALGTFLEKQGSPVEQCALLIYLLRQAGVPAVYEFPSSGGLQILDARLSQILKFQVHGAYNQAGQLYTTNTMITVNYPWVAAYIGTNWVHIFPWLKDYNMVEGLNLWEEMPINYMTAYQWVHDYLYGNTNLLNLSVDGDNTPGVIFPAYLKQTLLANHPGVSVDDIGMQVVNRQHYYSRWQDFPTPTWVTNVSTSLESLASPAITNINPNLTNIFDTVDIGVYSVTNPAEELETGNLRLCDLEDREFYINQFTNGTNVQLNLILMPFRPGITNQMAFGNDTNLLSKEELSLTLNSSDNALTMFFRYHRDRALSAAYAVDPYQAFLGLWASDEADFERPLSKGDQAAICMDYGRVTDDMLNVYSENIWQMENALATNPAFTNSVSPDVYEGATMYLAGLSYYENCDAFDQLNRNWNNINIMSKWDAGLSKIEPARNSSGGLLNGLITPILPAVDMFAFQIAELANGTDTPTSGQDTLGAQQNYQIIAVANDSAEEHQAINRFYQQTNAVSTVRLLQLAQSQGFAPVALNISNYVSQGTTIYQGQQLQSFDPGIWQQITNTFSSSTEGNIGNYAYITPGPITNSSYEGMGAFIIGWGQYSALISPQSLNGGFGVDLLSGTFSPANTINFNLIDFDDNYSMTLNTPATGTTLAPDNVAPVNLLDFNSLLQASTYALDSTESIITGNAALQYGLTLNGTADQNYDLASEFLLANGSLPPDDGGSTALDKILDPVHTITGEFYVDETDLKLPGPLPLALTRHYSSQNLANNQFGIGWKLNIMPYLCIGTGSTNIFAADMDGAVMTYVQTATNATVWLPTTAANPQLNNDNVSGVGGLMNRLRNRIAQTVNGSTTNFTLYGSDGSTRVFQWMSFNNGVVNQLRPYLQTWTDSRGNYYSFSYDTNLTDPSFGQMTRVQCSNGNYLGFDYDIYGHIIDAYTGDGRWTYYDYDEYGDLVTVTLPDSTTRSYTYLHGTQAVTNGTAYYSTHLIIEEDKPDGRVLQNTYDSQRRCTNQWSTAGADLNPIRTGTFIFSNNFNITNSYTVPITGYTLIIDANGHTNRYDYTNNLITKITDPLGQTVQQTWYADNATVPGYPRSLASRTDKRGLVTQYQYDNNGNITNTIVTGDITGDGITSQTATNTAIYNSNCLPIQTTDTAGNSVTTIYDSVFNFLPAQMIHSFGGTVVSTNYMLYGNATTIVTNGNTLQTNVAYGLMTRQIRAYSSPYAATNDMMYDGNGFITETIGYTGTSDLNVTNAYFYNERGDPVIEMDPSGAYTYLAYDACDRTIQKENFDQYGNPMAWNFYYYTDNGEISWEQGTHTTPADYIYYDYDGAGRPTTKIQWLAEASFNESGGPYVIAPSGFNLYAQTFYGYDPMGDCTYTVNPNGAMTTNTYDMLCRLATATHLETNGAVLSMESYGYEPGGEVKYYTNALGGVTTKIYNSLGKLEFQSNPDGSTNGWRYYLDGRVNKEIQGNGAYWQTTYNDINLITTRVLYSAAGVPEATNSSQVDPRGNVIQKTDADGNVYTIAYDGLDRVKVSAGPVLTVVTQSGSPPNFTNVTNYLQQVVTNFYNIVQRAVTNINELGETTISVSDAIGRPISKKIYSSTSTLVHETYVGYTPDHYGVIVTNGSGSTAVVTGTYSDTQGRTLLTVMYPSATVTDYTWSAYDFCENLVYQDRDSGSFDPNGWHGMVLTYDGLNRPILRVDRDNAVTTNSYDPMGDLTNRAMPGGLTWQATYSNAGQMLQEKYVGGGMATRTNIYSYYPTGNPFAGSLETKTDGRGVSCTYSYDDWQRPTNMAYSGSLPEQNLTTTWQYDPNGYVLGITEGFTNTNTGPTTSIQRSYDPYGNLINESVNGGSFSYSDSQGWDEAGRRIFLDIGDTGYNFGWQADGNLTSVANQGGTGMYTYDTAGILTERSAGSRSTTIISRDGEGRPLSIGTVVGSSSELTETLSYGGDGLIYTDTLARADFTDAHTYSYAYLSRRLTNEVLNLNASTTWTNKMVYDNGVGQNIGSLTQMGAGVSNNWNGVEDSFSRVNTETNNAISYPAYGHVNGQSTLIGWLDNNPIAIASDGTNTMQWRASMELYSGSHQLKVAALHPSGFYTAWATNSFTNKLAYQTTADTFDSAGDIVQRIWRNPNGTTNLIQTLSWDARGRLHGVTNRDSSNSGFNWSAVYDPLNRRLQTILTLVSNGVAYAVPPSTIDSYYDPQVEFLGVGVQYGDSQEWKLYGPDANGRYGGLNGTGGFDGASYALGSFRPTISDVRGNILAEITNGVAAWIPARPTGYGAVPGYRPVALGNGADVIQASAWRSRWVDITGYYEIGLRPYNPVSGGWLTYDSVWNDRDPNCYTFAGGDPINSFDPDGRANAGLYQQQEYNEAANQLENSPGLQAALAGVDYNAALQQQWYNSLPPSQQVAYNIPVPFLYNTVALVNDISAGNANAVGQDLQGIAADAVLTALTLGLGGGDIPEDSSAPAPIPTTQPSFYVTPDGTAIPATGYRALSANQADIVDSTGTIPARQSPTYITFDNISQMTPSQVSGVLQLPPNAPPPVAVGTFDTLQIANTLRTPTEYYNQGLFPEPITTSYPAWGPGGATQAITYSPINDVTVTPLQGINAPPTSITMPFAGQTVQQSQ